MDKSRALLLALSALLTSCSLDHSPPGHSAYGAELRRIDERIDALRDGTLTGATQRERGQTAYLFYLRASLTGDLRHFREAEQEIHAALRAHPQSAELLLLDADLDLKLHRLQPAVSALRRLWSAAPSVELVERFADAALQYGDYQEAGRLYGELVALEPTWDNLARLAYFKAHTGDRGGAEALYDRAQQLLSVREMRPYAWLELQKGILDLDDGQPGAALAHFERADEAYGGYWLIEEHIAEALSLLGRREEALAAYEQVLATVSHPYLIAALALSIGDSDPLERDRLLDDAQRGFDRDFALYPEAAVGHYVDQLLEAGRDPALAVQLAMRNRDARPNADSKAMLAQAYLSIGDRASATALIREVAATPWRTPSTDALLEAGRHDVRTP